MQLIVEMYTYVLYQLLFVIVIDFVLVFWTQYLKDTLVALSFTWTQGWNDSIL